MKTLSWYGENGTLLMLSIWIADISQKVFHCNGEPGPDGPSIFSRLETKKGKGISEINSIPLLLILTVDVISTEIGQDATAKLILRMFMRKWDF